MLTFNPTKKTLQFIFCNSVRSEIACYYFCSSHLRHDYLIKYAYFSKCHLERFASISAPDLKSELQNNVSQRKKHMKRDFK